MPSGFRHYQFVKINETTRLLEVLRARGIRGLTPAIIGVDSAKVSLAGSLQQTDRTSFFLSYRRLDNPSLVGRVYDRMVNEFGRERVLIDIDSIPLAVDYRKHLEKVISRCKAVLAIIGPRWEGKRLFWWRRIDQPTDPVRTEIETALRHEIPIFPLLTGGRNMPDANKLPLVIRSIAYRNAAPLNEGLDFHHHVSRVIEQLKAID